MTRYRIRKSKLHLLLADTVRLASIIFFSFLPIEFVGASNSTFQDSLFSDAKVLKEDLLQIGDTNSCERIALKIELAKVCRLAQEKGVKEFVTALTSCERLVRDLQDSFEFMELLRDSAEKWQTQNQSESDLSEVYLAIARIQARLGDHRGAYSYLEKTASLNFDSLSSDILAKYYFFHGYLAYYAQEIQSGSDYFELASQWSQKGSDIQLQVISLNAHIHCSNLLFDFEKGYDFSQVALEIIDAQKQEPVVASIQASIYINFAEALHGVGRKKEAYKYADNSLRLAEESKFKVHVGNAHCISSRLLRRDGNFDESKARASLALTAYKEASDPRSMLLAIDELIESTRAQADYKESLEFTTIYHHIKDSINSAKLLVEANSAELVRRSEQQRVALALMTEKSARQAADADRQRIERYALIALAVLFGLVTIGINSRLKSKKAIQLKLESEVSKRTEALSLQADRLKESNEELERFAYIASHDLKTPIRNVVSFLNLIERRMPEDQEGNLSEFIQIASENARQMHHLITDVLEFSKINAENEISTETFELGSEISKYVKLLDKEKLTFTLEGNANLNAPRAQEMQVFQNLIENGIKYNDSEHLEIDVTLSEKFGIVSCRVRDNGIGIDPQYKDRIFELFKRLHTSDRYEGTGLGLALCKKIVERFGGTISVDSYLGKGSIFTVELPVHCSERSGTIKKKQSEIAVMN